MSKIAKKVEAKDALLKTENVLRWAGRAAAVVSILQQVAADAGMFEAVVAAMRSAPDNLVQHLGCCSTNIVADVQPHMMCMRSDGGGAADTRRDRAAQAGAIEAAVEAMRLYPQNEDVQSWACSFLAILAHEHRELPGSALVRTRRILAANPMALLESARASFPQNDGWHAPCPTCSSSFDEPPRRELAR